MKLKKLKQQEIIVHRPFMGFHLHASTKYIYDLILKLIDINTQHEQEKLQNIFHIALNFLP